MIRKTLFTIKEEEKATRDGFGIGLVKEASENKKIVALCADLTESTRLEEFKNNFPDRFFEVGITEQAMSGVASGFASSGYIPFMASYAMFSPGRNWEQIRTTIAYNNVPVKIVGAHSGVSVGPDGATHQAIEDIAIMRVVPNMEIYVPCDYVEAREMISFISKTGKPAYIRLTREVTPVILDEEYKFSGGKPYIIKLPVGKNGKEFSCEVGIIACGPVIYEAIKASNDLEKEGIGVTVVNAPCIKPFDHQFLMRFVKGKRAIFTLEEHQIKGGLGGEIAEFYGEHHPIKVIRMGINDRFGQSGKIRDLYKEYNLDSESIKEKIKSNL